MRRPLLGEMSKPLAASDEENTRYLTFDDTPSDKPHLSSQGSILSAEVTVGEKLEDGYAITTVFERRKNKPAHRKCIESIYDNVEFIYAKHFVMPDPPDEGDSDEDKEEYKQESNRIFRNRCCCCWWWILVLAAIIFLIVYLVWQDHHKAWHNQTSLIA